MISQRTADRFDRIMSGIEQAGPAVVITSSIIGSILLGHELWTAKETRHIEASVSVAVPPQESQRGHAQGQEFLTSQGHADITVYNPRSELENDAMIASFALAGAALVLTNISRANR
jgi:hypothetical protein